MLKLAHRAHPHLQAILIDISCYKAQVVAKEDFAPQGIAWGPELDWEERATQLELEEEEIAALAPSLETEQTPLGSRFYPGKFVHLQFDGGST